MHVSSFASPHALRLVGTAGWMLALLLVAAPVHAQNAPTEYVQYRSATGETRMLVATDDADGDGIDNALEVNGFTYDVLTGFAPCPSTDPTVCFFTDALSWTTDQDPYSDYTEATGINMPRGVRPPYNHPLVAARPIITVGLVRYTVTPTNTITDTEGKSISSSWTNETSNQHEVGGSVTVGAELNPFKLASVEVSAHYSYTNTKTESSTRDTTVDVSKATTVTPERAARLKLEVFYLNLGSADAHDVRPSFNVLIGDRRIFTYSANEAEETAALLTARNGNPSPGQSRYPQGTGGIILGDTQGAGEIAITLDELKALEAGAPLSIEVTKIDAEIVRFNEDGTWGCDVRRNCTWPLYEAGMGPVSTVVNVDIGDDSREYHVFAGHPNFDPDLNLREVLSLVMDVEDRADGTYLNGVKFPDDWYLSSPSQALLDAYDASDPLATPMESETQVFLATPGTTPGPTVNLASYSPDLRDILVLPTANGAFPVNKVEAFVFGQAEPIPLVRTQNGAFYRMANTGAMLPSSGGFVEATDAAGFTTRAPITQPAFDRSCADVSSRLNEDDKSATRTYTIFHGGDPETPIDVWCDFSKTVPQTLYFQSINLDTRAFYNVHFADRRNGVLVGQNKQVVTTTDGGMRAFTWHGSRVGLSGSAHDAHMIDSLTIHVVGNAGTNYAVTTDGGATWNSRSISAANLIGLDFLNADTAVAVGSSGTVLLTTDGGKTWNARPAGTSFNLNDVDIVSPTFAVAVGQAGRFSYTTGDLQNWTAKIVTTGTFHSVAFRDEQTGMMVGDGGKIMKTTDGGATWTQQPSTTSESLRRVQFVTDSLALVAGLNGTILRSLDGGETWKPLNDPSGLLNTSAYKINYIGLHAFSENDYYLVGHRVSDGNGAYVTTRSAFGNPRPTNTIIVAAEPIDALPGEAATLVLGQSYPNPVRGQATIRYAVARSSHVTLAVYDLLGRRVATLVDAFQPAGEHEAHVDAADLSSGTYVYRLQSGGQAETRTMVVVR